MEISGTLLLIILVSAGASFLTFFSGFGLGTILLPVFSIFFPVEIAIMATAIVHFINNLIKGALVFKNADRAVVLRFGGISILGAFAGAGLFALLDPEVIRLYTIADMEFAPTLTGIVIGSFLLIFSFLEILPASRSLQFKRDYLVPGGFVSGFFGGLSGHQGALRTAFLSRVGLSKEAFIATGVMIACLVDITRIPFYFGNLSDTGTWNDPLLVSTLICSCTGAAFGAVTGNYFLKKSGLTFIRSIVSIFLLLMGILMIMGIRW